MYVYMILAPPPCWRLILVWHVSPLYTHPLAQPSGPSNIALDSSVNSRKFISVFMYFFDHSIRKRRCLGVRGGFVLGLLIAATFLRRRLRVVFGTFTRPASSKIFALFAPGIFRMLLLNPRKSRLVTDFRTPRWHRGFLLEGLCTNHFTVPTWWPISLAIASGALPVAISLFIVLFFFSQVFTTSQREQRVLKVITRSTPFIEDGHNFLSTWPMLNVNIEMMFPHFPQTICHILKIDFTS